MLFFRLWFAFVGTLALAAMAFSIYVAVKSYSFASDPAELGRYVGELVNGYNEKVK